MTPVGDGITGKVPDSPTTRLAFRVWRYDSRRGALLSLNAGSPVRRNTWFLPNAISSPEGDWNKAGLIAQCGRSKQHENGVPDPGCSCGIYAAIDLQVVSTYLSREAPVLGIVELGGRTIPATQGYRAEAARVAAILLVDEMFTLHHATLEKVAAQYEVPPLVPHSVVAEEYRSELQRSGLSPADWEQLKRLLDEG